MFSTLGQQPDASGNTDRPLWIQFCSNDPEDLVNAATYVQSYCDYIDLNLGCPQRIARKGNYGAFLMDQIPLVERMVSEAAKRLETPISVKIRVFEDVRETIRYAKRLEAAGAYLVCVHGRTKEQKHIGSHPADWEQIRAVREALQVVFFYIYVRLKSMVGSKSMADS